MRKLSPIKYSKYKEGIVLSISAARAMSLIKVTLLACSLNDSFNSDTKIDRR